MKTQAAAIEFGTSKVVTVFAESGGFARCEIIGSGTVYYDGYKGGVWNRPDLLAEAVRNSINAAELHSFGVCGCAVRIYPDPCGGSGSCDQFRG